jgi:hypothetical protein
MGLVVLSIIIEMTIYTLLKVPAPAGLSSRDLILLFPIKVLFDSIFVFMFRLSAGSKLAENGLLYGFLWFLGFSVPQEIGFWLVYKYAVITAYAGLLSGLLTFPLWGLVLKKIKLP